MKKKKYISFSQKFRNFKERVNQAKSMQDIRELRYHIPNLVGATLASFNENNISLDKTKIMLTNNPSLDSDEALQKRFSEFLSEHALCNGNGKEALLTGELQRTDDFWNRTAREKTVIFNEILKPFEVFHQHSCLIFNLGNRLVILSIGRPRHFSPFSHEELENFKKICNVISKKMVEIDVQERHIYSEIYTNLYDLYNKFYYWINEPEDTIQTALGIAWENMYRFGSRENGYKSYVKTIIKNKDTDIWRKYYSKTDIVDFSSSSDYHLNISSTESIKFILESHEKEQLIENELQKEKERDREIIKDSILRQIKGKDIAARVGLSENRISEIVTAFKRKMRRAIKEGDIICATSIN